MLNVQRSITEERNRNPKFPTAMMSEMPIHRDDGDGARFGDGRRCSECPESFEAASSADETQRGLRCVVCRARRDRSWPESGVVPAPMTHAPESAGASA